jgi:CBS domain containing-hemolysin-like protein
VEILEEGVVRVPSRFPLGDLDELLGVDLEDEDVDSVGGLITKLLGKVPIAGASVEAEGLRFTAEGVTGRRNRIGSVVVRRLEPDPATDEDED